MDSQKPVKRKATIELYRNLVIEKLGGCAICGTKESIHIHHKDGNPENNDPGNLEILCQKHHYAKHWGEPKPHDHDCVVLEAESVEWTEDDDRLFRELRRKRARIVRNKSRKKPYLPRPQTIKEKGKTDFAFF